MFERHSILRTSFSANAANEPIQIVHKEAKLPIRLEDLRSLCVAKQKQFIENFMQEDRGTGFDLEQAPLMRVALFQLQDDHYQMLWSRHHLLLDGWSSARLIQEVMTAYKAVTDQVDHDVLALLNKKPATYRSYINWLNKQDNRN